MSAVGHQILTPSHVKPSATKTTKDKWFQIQVLSSKIRQVFVLCWIRRSCPVSGKLHVQYWYFAMRTVVTFLLQIKSCLLIRSRSPCHVLNQTNTTGEPWTSCSLTLCLLLTATLDNAHVKHFLHPSRALLSHVSRTVVCTSLFISISFESQEHNPVPILKFNTAVKHKTRWVTSFRNPEKKKKRR